jgi:quinol monooxygenase YgiN
MFVRLTFCKFSPEKIREVKKIYSEEIIPSVRRQKGNLNIRLLEPSNKSDDFISISEWKKKSDAEMYEAAGIYKKLLAKLNPYYTKEPELKTYMVEEAVVPTDHL